MLGYRGGALGGGVCIAQPVLVHRLRHRKELVLLELLALLWLLKLHGIVLLMLRRRGGCRRLGVEGHVRHGERVLRLEWLLRLQRLKRLHAVQLRLDRLLWLLLFL